jgi:hypothetical protein
MSHPRIQRVSPDHLRTPRDGARNHAGRAARTVVSAAEDSIGGPRVSRLWTYLSRHATTLKCVGQAPAAPDSVFEIADSSAAILVRGHVFGLPMVGSGWPMIAPLNDLPRRHATTQHIASLGARCRSPPCKAVAQSQEE